MSIDKKFFFMKYFRTMNILIKLASVLCIAIIPSFLSAFALDHLDTNDLEEKYKNLDVEKSAEAKMPYILHHVWLTHPSSPREISEVDFANLIATKSIFGQAPVKWKHIVWCNDPEIIPLSVAKLREFGIEVKSIYEHQEDLRLFKFIETLVENKLWGTASDTLRISVLESFGGVYADLNYVFNREVTEEVHKYNFFATSFLDELIGNYFFGSGPGHPILREALNVIDRSFNKGYKDLNEFHLTLTTTTLAIDLAYYLRGNLNGNKDVIYPSTSYYRKMKMGENFIQEGKELEIEMVNGVEICGIEEQFIGYDSSEIESSDGKTWLDGK